MENEKGKSKKVVFCTPFLSELTQPYSDSMTASAPLLDQAGWDHSVVYEIGCPYISAARAKMLRKAMDAQADVVVFIDYDLSWQPDDLVRLIEKDDPCVAGTYRYKRDKVEFMGRPFQGPTGRPIGREEDNCVKMFSIPAGFLKITKHAVNEFMKQYPELLYGDRFAPYVDLFNHGAHQWTWYGEDYAFARRYNEKVGPIWLIPDLQLVHNAKVDGKYIPYGGTYDSYLRSLPGGANDSQTKAS